MQKAKPFTNFSREAVTTALDNAIAQRELWQANEYRTSNQKLYAILGQCYQLYGSYLADPCKSDWKARFSNIAVQYGISKKDAASKLRLSIVRIVFGSGDICRRRVSTYAGVLSVAAKESVSLADFSNWIEQSGGVQEVSRSKASNGISRDQKVELVKAHAHSIGRVTVAGIADFADPQDQGNYVVVVAQIGAGTRDLKHVFKDAAHVDPVCASLFANLKKSGVIPNAALKSVSKDAPLVTDSFIDNDATCTSGLERAPVSDFAQMFTADDEAKFAAYLTANNLVTINATQYSPHADTAAA
jgi:hypothetical protein